MLNHYALSSLLTAVSVLVLGLFVFHRSIKARANRYFFFLSLAISWWSFGLYFHTIFQSKGADVVLFFGRFLHFGAILIPIFLYSLVLVLVNNEKKNRALLGIFYALTGALLILDLTPAIIRSVSPKLGYAFWVDPGLLYPLHIITTISLVLMSAYELFNKFRASSGTKRDQMRYFLFAVLVGYGGGGFNYLLNYSVNISLIAPYINYAILIYVVITAYTIVTTRLMDIEVVIRKGIVYASLSTFMAVMYFSTLYLSEYVFRRITGLSSLWVAIPLVTVFSLLIQPLRLRIQEFVDNMFFKARYDYQKILAKYTHALKRPTTDLDRFLKLAPYLIRKAMKLSGAGMLVLNRRQLRYELRAGEAAHRGLIGTTISDNHEIVKELLRTGEPLILDDVKQEIREGARDQGLGVRKGELGTWERIIKEMADLKATLLIPSISKSEYFKEPVLLAIFDFGGKLSEDSFSGSDIEFLQTIARQASIVIEYAFILEELRRDEQQIVGAEKFAALGTMAGSVVSALKGPIEDMETYSIEMAKKFDDKLFREGFTKDIPADINKLDRVVNDLLVYARPMKLNLIDVKLNDLVKKAVDLLRIKEMKEHVVVNEAFTDGPFIQADPQQLLNALMRLFSYSIAAAKGEINVSTGPEDGHVVVNIEIPRSVIPREALAKIFTSYYSPKEGEGGLELATAAKIIREHNGDVKIESNANIGTRIVAGLPV